MSEMTKKRKQVDIVQASSTFKHPRHSFPQPPEKKRNTGSPSRNMARTQTIYAPNGGIPGPMQQLTHDSLESLQNDNARHLMDTVDRLRKAGLGAIIQLPQIVTVGDQSSGKSSTLEAITGIPFPRKENLCTRFATQIVLRRARTESVSVSILPDKLRPPMEQQQLESMHLTLEDFTQLESLIDQATEAMGLSLSPQSETDGDDSNVKAFSRDVLVIEISGPTRPHLTLVDLPGLIHSHTKQQSRHDVELIKHLVGEYMEEKRTIVLAVVSAKNDYANQIVLSKASDLKADERTLGIITKVDALQPGSENERSWLNLAANKDVYFGLGWHMLRNRAPHEMSSSLEERDAEEGRFFSVGNYRQLDRDTLGIHSLRERLSILLYRHLTEELPNLQQELEAKHRATVKELELLGASRRDVREQRQFLMRLGQKFERITELATSGYYEGDFFAIDTTKEITDVANISRLRAVVQHSNMQFAHQIRRYGAKYRILRSDHSPGTRKEEDDLLYDSDDNDIAPSTGSFRRAKAAQKNLTRTQALDWVRDVLERSRGRELVGNFNPLLIGQLFWEQSEPWEMLAAKHVDRIAIYCGRFVEHLLQSISSGDVFQRIKTHMIEPGLLKRKQQAHSELKKILEDKKGDPITYNHYYTTTVQEIRRKQRQKKQQRALNALGSKDTVVVLASVHNCLAGGGTTEEDMDRFSAEEALTCEMAFYKDELKYFTNCVAKQVIERCLIKGLATDILSAVKFGMMDDKQITSLARELPTVVAEREQLTRKLEMLEEGQDAFRKELGGF